MNRTVVVALRDKISALCLSESKEELVKALQDKDWEIREVAVEKVARLFPETVELLEVLKDQDFSVRHSLVVSLPEGHDLIKKLKKDPDPDVRAVAQERVKGDW